MESQITDSHLRAKVKGNFSKYKPYFTSIVSEDDNNIYVKKTLKAEGGKLQALYDLFSREGIYLDLFTNRPNLAHKRLLQMRGVAHTGDPPQMGHREADAVRSVRLKG
jgi:hypothetical protein